MIKHVLGNSDICIVEHPISGFFLTRLPVEDMVIVLTLTVRTIHFTHQVADYIREKIWHPTQQLKTLPDDGVALSVQLSSLVEIQRWVQAQFQASKQKLLCDYL